MDVVDIDQVEIKEDLSLAELRKIKEKIKGKMGLNDDLEPVRPDQKDQEVEEVEDGEVLSEEEEEEEEEKKTEDRNRKIQDLRQKLSRDSDSPVAVSVDNRYVVLSSRQFTYLLLTNIVTGQHQSSPTSARRSRPVCRTTVPRTSRRSSSPSRSGSSMSSSSRRPN